MDNHKTIKEAIQSLSVSDSTIRRMLKDGKLSKVKVQNKIYIPVTELDRVLTKRDLVMTQSTYSELSQKSVMTESELSQNLVSESQEKPPKPAQQEIIEDVTETIHTSSEPIPNNAIHTNDVSWDDKTTALAEPRIRHHLYINLGFLRYEYFNYSDESSLIQSGIDFFQQQLKKVVNHFSRKV